jgi:hypothetical protein
MRIILSLLFTLLIFQCVSAQQGNVQVIADERIDLLVEKHKYYNRHQPELEGWRIQIFFDAGANSKRKATEVQNRFTSRYHGTEAYLSFKEPYYRVRIGDFRTRIEAEGFLQKIKGEYPNGFAVSEPINPPPIVRENAPAEE